MIGTIIIIIALFTLFQVLDCQFLGLKIRLLLKLGVVSGSSHGSSSRAMCPALRGRTTTTRATTGRWLPIIPIVVRLLIMEVRLLIHLLLLGLLEEFLLSLQMKFVATQLLLSKLLLPLFALLTTAIGAREAVELLGVGDGEGMTAPVTSEGDL